METIIQNAVKIDDDGTIVYLPSIHQHHFNTHTFKDGTVYSVDGGHAYFRRGYTPGNQDRVEQFNLDSSSTIKQIRDRLLWGNRGVDGKSPITYLPFKEMTLEHLKAVLDYNTKLKQGLNERQIAVIEYWIAEKSKTC